MSEFKREGRYIVVKPDFEDSLRTVRLRNYIDEMCFKTPDCVVVEADWPEYETVWRMIERRVTGASADAKPVEVLGYSVVGNRYAIRLTKGEVLELSEYYAEHLIELVDRKNLTDAQVELAALREELNEKGWDEMMTRLEDQNESLRQRLAAAEQRNMKLAELLKECLNVVRLGEDFDLPVTTMNRIDAALKPTESGASEWAGVCAISLITKLACVKCSAVRRRAKTIWPTSSRR